MLRMWKRIGNPWEPRETPTIGTWLHGLLSAAWTTVSCVDYCQLCGLLSAVWTTVSCVDYCQLCGLLLAVWTVDYCQLCGLWTTVNCVDYWTLLPNFILMISKYLNKL